MEEGLQLRLWNLNSAYNSPVASHQLSCQISTNQWEAEPANCRCISGRCFSPCEKRTQLICDFLRLWKCPVSNLHGLILFLGLWSLGRVILYQCVGKFKLTCILVHISAIGYSPCTLYNVAMLEPSTQVTMYNAGSKAVDHLFVFFLFISTWSPTIKVRSLVFLS